VSLLDAGHKLNARQLCHELTGNVDVAAIALSLPIVGSRQLQTQRVDFPFAALGRDREPRTSLLKLERDLVIQRHIVCDEFDE
jgi:hypothetical protein